MSEAEIRQTLERTVQELQQVSSQSAALSAQLSEIDQTLALLESQAADRPVCRQVGPVLVEVEDRAALSAEIQASRATFAEAAERAAAREAELRDAYTRIIQQLESA